MNNNTKRITLFALFCMILSTPAFGQSVGVAPSEDGQLNPSLEFNWEYPDTDFGSGLYISLENKSETSEEPLIGNFDASITTVLQGLYADIKVLTYTLDLDSINVIPGIGIQYDYYDIQEVGFFNFDASTRIFLNNDRFIHALRPGASISIEAETNGFKAELTGFYAPLFFILLNQDFSSASADNAAYDTPQAEHTFEGQGNNAWGASAGIAYESEGFIAGIEADFTGFDIKYDYISFGANTFVSDTTSISGKIELKAGTPFLTYNGVMPLIGGGIKFDFSKDNSIADSEWLSEQLPIYITVGIQVLEGE